eukprot:1358333-Amphidinium_carterae.1
MRACVRTFCEADFNEPAQHWFARVPSKSNLADEPSRCRGCSLVGLVGPWPTSEVSLDVAIRRVWSLVRA